MPDLPDKTPSLHRGLKPLAMFGMMFFLACGGPGGLEEVVVKAGPGLAIVGLFAMAFVWAIPNALITAELVTAIPKEGGSYQWYRKALGPFWSFQFSWLNWITWVVDAAIYPPLLAAYILKLFYDEPNHWAAWLICLVVIWSCTGLNLRGVKAVGNFSVVMAVVVMLPYLVMVILGWSEVSLAPLRQWIPEGESLSGALSYLLIWGMWSYSGYSGLAIAAEEIVDPERSYPKVLAFFMPLTVAVYVLPLLVALGVDPNWTEWKTAHFYDVGFILAGVWLGTAISIAAPAATLSGYPNSLLIMSRLPYAMARDGLLPRVLARLDPRQGTPNVILIIQALLLSVMTYYWGFVEVLVFGIWLAMPVYLAEFTLPIILRWKHPELRGTFRIPGGWPGLFLVCAMPTTLCLYVLFMVPSELFEGGLGQIFVALACITAGPLLYQWSRWTNKRSETTGGE